MNLGKIKYLLVLLCLIHTSCVEEEDSAETIDTPSKSGYQVALDAIRQAGPEVQASLQSAPQVYEFSSRFAETSSVSYSGQTFRQVLIDNLKAYIGTLGRGEFTGSAQDAFDALDSYYTYDLDGPATHGGINAASLHNISGQGLSGEPLPLLQGDSYEDIYSGSKQLRDKTAGNDNDLRLGELKGWRMKELAGLNLNDVNSDGNGDTFVEPEDLIDLWFKVIAKNATDGVPFLVKNGSLEQQKVNAAYLTEEGLDLNQLIQKFLHGAVSFSQAAGDYLSTDLGETKGLNGLNIEPTGSKPYSALEHHWDEAFGYLGASRDFLAYTDEEIASKRSRDTNGDGSIDIASEKNLGIAANAAKRDLGSATGIDLTSALMNALVRGRHLISEAPEGYLPVVKAYGVVVAEHWERTIAATVIHYINKVMSEMDQYGTEDYLFKDHAKYWSELKGYALAFQFNPNSSLDKEAFERFHDLVGDLPVLGTAAGSDQAAYKEKLVAARNILGDAYKFSDEDVQNW